MILVYDTETSGFVNSKEAASHPSQPHLVQLACILLDDTGIELQSVNLTVRPDGWTIPEGASKIHGITTEKALATGVPLKLAVACFTNLRGLATVKAAHNLDFDELVMAAALHRTGGMPASPGPAKGICTMRASIDLLKLPPTARMVAAGFAKYKPPNLQELHTFLFKETFDGAHDAMADCRACARSLVELRKRGVA